MNKYEKAISMVDIINSDEFKDKCISLYLESDIAYVVTDILLDQISLFHEDTEENVMEVLNDNEEIVIAINRYDNGEEELFVDPLLHEGIQFKNEGDAIFIQDELLDVVELDKIDGELIVLCDDEDEEENTELFLEDLTQELLETILESDEDTCIHCLVKDYLREAYDIGYNDSQIDMED